MSTKAKWERKVREEAKVVDRFCCDRAKSLMIKLRDAGRSDNEIAGFINLDPMCSKPPGRLNNRRVSAWLRVVGQRDERTRGRFASTRKSLMDIVSTIERDLESKNKNKVEVRDGESIGAD